MSMSTYDEMVSSIKGWLNRENFPALDLEMEDLIAMGQRRIHRTADLKEMEKKTSFLSSAPTVPSDYLRTKVMRYSQGGKAKIITGAPLIDVLDQAGAGPTMYAIEAGEFVFGPEFSSEQTIDLTYYYPLPILSPTNTTNWFSQNVPELLLFAALTEASLWLKDDQRTAVWEGRYRQTLADLEASEEQADKEPGALRVRLKGFTAGFESVRANG